MEQASKEAPLFSVIIPTYNRAGKCIRAVESVLQQTCQDYELWVIDDGSIDETQTVLKPYENRLHYHYQPNQGVSVARNTGIRLSHGRYLAFLDADDRWVPGKLAAVAAAVQENPDVGMFYSSAAFVDEQGCFLWTVKARNAKGNAYFALLSEDFIVFSSTVLKRDCLDRLGIFDPQLHSSQDWDLIIRVARNYPIIPLSPVLVLYEYDAPDKITKNYRRWIAEHDQVLEKAFQDDPNLGPSQKRQIFASTAYIKGRICLQARDDVKALAWFQQSVRLNIKKWKSWIYVILLRFPLIRRNLPGRIKLALRLPESTI